MDVFLTILTGVAIAGLSSWITVHLSLKRFRTEKWWEMRADAYSRLLGTIHDAKAFAEEHLEADIQGLEISKEEDKELREKSQKAEAEIYRAMDVGAFYLSVEAINRLKAYKNHPRDDNVDHSWGAYLVSEHVATDSCLKDMIKIARKDLSIRLR